jgi:hypothetical protein
MRWIIATILGGVFFCGCASHKSETKAPGTVKAEAPQNNAKTKSKGLSSTQGAPFANASSLTITNGAEIITLSQSISGKITAVNPALRFAVLDFTLNRPPELRQRLSVYRGTLKVGEVKVTGPEMNGNIVADLVEGEAQIGDVVRQE